MSPVLDGYLIRQENGDRRGDSNPIRYGPFGLIAVVDGYLIGVRTGVVR